MNPACFLERTTRTIFCLGHWEIEPFLLNAANFPALSDKLDCDPFRAKTAWPRWQQPCALPLKWSVWEWRLCECSTQDVTQWLSLGVAEWEVQREEGHLGVILRDIELVWGFSWGLVAWESRVYGYEGVSHLILFSLVALEKSLISADTCTGHFLVIVNSPMVIQLVS